MFPAVFHAVFFIVFLAAALAGSLAISGCAKELPSEARIEREPRPGLIVLETRLLEIVAQEPESASALLRLALAQLRLGKLAASARSALRAQAAAPFSAGPLVLLGRVYVAQGKHLRARAALREAVALRPSLLSAYVPYALTSERLGEPEQAIATLRTALARAPGNFPARYHLARLLLARGSRSEAGAAIAEARRLRPDDRDALELRIVVLAAQGRFSAAAALAEETLSEKTGAAERPSREPERQRRFLRTILVRLHIAQQNWSGAGALLTRMERIAPLTPRARLLRADTLEGRGRRKEALAVLRSLFRDQPRFAPATLRLGRALTLLGRYREAIALLDGLLEKRETREAMEGVEGAAGAGDAIAQAFYWKAVAHFQLHQYRRGETALALAERLRPENRGVRMLRMVRETAAGRLERAETLLGAYRKEHPGDPGGWLAEIALLTRKGRLSQARLALEHPPKPDGRRQLPPQDLRFAGVRLAALEGRHRDVLKATAPLPEKPALRWRTAYLRARSLWWTGKSNDALALLHAFRNREEAAAELFHLAGYLHWLGGDPVEAEKMFLSGRSRFPFHPLLIEGLSRLALEKGDWRRAKDLLTVSLRASGLRETGPREPHPYRSLFRKRLRQANRKARPSKKSRGESREALRDFLASAPPFLAETIAPDGKLLFGATIPEYPQPWRLPSAH